MILGLGQPDVGTVSVLGMTPSAAISRGLIAAVMQTGGLLKDLTVRETLRLTASVFESRPVDEVLERAGIARIADRLVGKCSGGEQQPLVQELEQSAHQIGQASIARHGSIAAMLASLLYLLELAR